MKSNARIKGIYLPVCALLVATLACNLPTPREPVATTPEVESIFATPTAIALAETPVDQTSPSPTSPADNTGTSISTESAGGNTTVSSDGAVFTSVSIKDGNASYQGDISFPGSNTSDDIYVKPIGFDSVTTSGNLVFNLTCSGRGKAKVNYKGGLIESGSPGCGESWTIYVINGSPDSQITIRLDATGDVDWELTVTSGE